MSKTKLLFDVADGLRSLADNVRAIAEAMADSEPTEALQPEKLKTEKEEKCTVKTVTLEQVRTVLADKSQQGYTADVRALLEKYGAPKLSQIDPANYAALLEDAEGLK